MGAVERSRVAHPGRLGADGTGEPPGRVPVERRPRSHRGGDRYRRARRADGLLGGAVRDHRVGRVAARSGDQGGRPAAPSAVRRGGVRVLRRTRGGRDRERPPGHRAGGPTGLRVVRARIRDVHRGARTGLLRQPGSLHRADPRGRRHWTAPVRRTGSPRTSTACSLPAGSRRRWSWPSPPLRRRARSAIPTGWSTRCGSSGWPTRRRTRSGRWRPGTTASRSSAPTRSGSSRDSWPATPPSCTPRTVSWRRR